MAATDSPKTFFISYGFAEGPWHSKKLRNSLAQAGCMESGDPMSADIIISHSGGCFFLPQPSRARLTLLIGVPFSPDRQLAVTLVDKIRNDFLEYSRKKLLRKWLTKTIWNLVYLLLHLPRNITLCFKAVRQNRIGVSVPGKAVLVRNQEDPFCRPEIAKHTIYLEHIHESLPGSHDDCWSNPDPYVELIRKHYEQ